MTRLIDEYLKIEASNSFWNMIDNIVNELDNVASCQSLYINDSHISAIGNNATINEEELKYAFTLLVTSSINEEDARIITNIENTYNICLNSIYYEEDDMILLHSFIDK